MNEYWEDEMDLWTNHQFNFIIGPRNHNRQFLKSLILAIRLQEQVRYNPDKEYIIVTGSGAHTASKAYLRAIAVAGDLRDFAAGFGKPDECQHDCPACIACDDFYADFCAHKLQKEPGDVQDNSLLPLCQVLREDKRCYSFGGDCYTWTDYSSQPDVCVRHDPGD